MRKNLNLFAQAILISSLSFSVSACYNPFTNDNGNGNNNDNGNDNGGTKPPDPITKDIKYYQELIKKTEDNIEKAEIIIAQMKKEKENSDGTISDEEFDSVIEELSAGLYVYKSQVNEYQYQILLLEKIGDKFTKEQIKQGIKITEEWIKNLEEAKKLAENHFNETEKQKIKTNLEKAKKIKTEFDELNKEEK